MGKIQSFLDFVRKTITDFWNNQIYYYNNRETIEKENLEKRKEYLKARLEVERLNKQIRETMPKQEEQKPKWGVI